MCHSTRLHTHCYQIIQLIWPKDFDINYVLQLRLSTHVHVYISTHVYVYICLVEIMMYLQDFIYTLNILVLSTWLSLLHHILLL